MRNEAPSFFDAHMVAGGLAPQELELLQHFGLKAALIAMEVAPLGRRSTSVQAMWELLLQKTLPALEEKGIQTWVMLGVHPLAIPKRGVEDAIASLAHAFKRGKVKAIGPIGLQAGGPVEEAALISQLQWAKKVKVPVWVHTPSRNKEALTRRTLQILKRWGPAPTKVLVDHAQEKTIKLILEQGHFASLTLHPDHLTAERALKLIKQHGSKRLIVSSNLGRSAGDLLGIPRLISRLLRAGFNDELIERLTWSNAARFLQVKPRGRHAAAAESIKTD